MSVEWLKRMVFVMDADRRTLLIVAADSLTDPRSVARALRGEHVRGDAGQRIHRALEARGLVRSNPPRDAA